MDHSKAIRPRLGEGEVERQDRALTVVQRLLRERGIRSRCHHTISLGLSAVREGGAACTDGASSVIASASGPSFWLERFPPELAVTGPQGWPEATVTIGVRSGAYLLSLRNGPDLQKVARAEPEKVASLIAGALGVAR
ncbi:hypothetical protein [Streptosporangium sp. NPDC004631]